MLYLGYNCRFYVHKRRWFCDITISDDIYIKVSAKRSIMINKNIGRVKLPRRIFIELKGKLQSLTECDCVVDYIYKHVVGNTGMFRDIDKVKDSYSYITGTADIDERDFEVDEKEVISYGKIKGKFIHNIHGVVSGVVFTKSSTYMSVDLTDVVDKKIALMKVMYECARVNSGK